MKYVCVQPRLAYYSWQLEVMLNNFIKHDVNPNDIQILIAYNPDQNDRTNHPDVVELYNRLMLKFSSVKFFFYRDTRVNPSYISSVRPNILKQHFKNFPELEKEIIFYHDSDIVFTKTPDFSKFLSNKIWYMSNTEGYIGSRYILEKGEDIYQTMCKIVNIDPKIPKIMESNSGGAQYIIKNVNSFFWEKVEIDCENLYKFFLQDEPKKMAINPKYHPIQKWTSDMWAILWNAWYFEHETRVDNYLTFTWATDLIERWSENLIFHNAGVTKMGELFYKGAYINSLPYFIENTFDPKFASYNYFQEIMETKENSCLISSKGPFNQNTPNAISVPPPISSQ